MATLCRDWLGRYSYSLAMSFNQCAVGISHRGQLCLSLLLRLTRGAWNTLLAVFAFLGFGALAVWQNLPAISRGIGALPLPNPTAAVKWWHSLPSTPKLGVAVILFALALSAGFLLLRFLSSKERLFRIATGRLTDRVPSDKRALSDNREAEALIQAIKTGEARPLWHTFLCQLWEPYLGDTQALSLISIPTPDGQLVRIPVVSVQLPSSYGTPAPSFDTLGNLLRVQLDPRFPDTRSGGGRGRALRGPTVRLFPHTPLPRYLRRYQGPSPKQTGFRDDYEGYNACLRSAALTDDGLELPLDCTLEFYGNIIDSCDLLIEELYLHFSLPQPQSLPRPEHVLRHLPWRYCLHHLHRENPRELLTTPKTRAAGFGVCALTVFNKEGTYVAVRGTRSSAVGTYRDAYHVVPAGMTNVDPGHRDSCTDSIKELVPGGMLNVKLLLEKEFLEEIFSEEWAATLRTWPASWPRLVREKAREHLYGADSGSYDAEIHLTGIAVDLLNYRPEVCALILIRNREWWDSHRPYGGGELEWRLSWEWDEEGKLVDVQDAAACANAMAGNSWVMSGLAAFHLGVQKARELIA